MLEEALAIDGTVDKPRCGGRSWRRAARKVMVFQWPCGAFPGKRCPHGAHPRSGAMLVLVQVSSMKTRRLGSMRP